MANHTWMEATNEVLELSQIDPIASADDFNNPTGALNKPQRGARAFIRLAHSHLSVRAYKHFATRRMELLISSSSGSVYPLDTGMNPEHIRPERFFNITTGTAAAKNQELAYYEYARFMRDYPDPSLITSSSPEAWILLPVERTDESPIHKVRIFPNPDQDYKLEYQAALNAPPLTTATSVLLWPPEYEHVLWEFAWDLLERGLGEGKEGSIAGLAAQAANEVKLVAGRLADAKRAFRFMRMPSRRVGNRGYNSPRSVDANGTAID
jgi:hypothetical protein